MLHHIVLSFMSICVVSRIMALQYVYFLFHRTEEYGILHGKRDFAEMVNLRILIQGDDPRVFLLPTRPNIMTSIPVSERWKQKSQTIKRRKSDNESRSQSEAMTGIQDGEGAPSQGIQVIYRSWEGQGRFFQNLQKKHSPANPFIVSLLRHMLIF